MLLCFRTNMYIALVSKMAAFDFKSSSETETTHEHETLSKDRQVTI